ncbi:30S ribosomal protein S17 [Brevibacterium sp. UCMA 11754]|uniref:30S ribosomal protein S17 n=1 Tax=Brevibacterium sp. UCMA 11754 TaxID=2749198 RepID=UPI001F2062C2|nr:30S ribosomal protein S17 [Brevibacterium sp. UCMA 11754]MCF2571277.1 30S ribosomal protein S17 [Brevibacterium sp. UCMA 11754]
MAETTKPEAKPADRNSRKTARGYVVSDKMEKTIVVEVEERKTHRLYGKVLRQSVKYKVHDEENAAGVGDLVLVSETRPVSSAKRWRLVEIIERAK